MHSIHRNWDLAMIYKHAAHRLEELSVCSFTVILPRGNKIGWAIYSRDHEQF